jgi:hypothetical protein
VKITSRIATTEYSYIEAEFDTLTEFDAFYAKIKERALQEKGPTTPAALGTPVSMPTPAQYAPRPTGNQKVVGEPCPDCLTPFVQGSKGPYCKKCYIAWKNSQQ